MLVARRIDLLYRIAAPFEVDLASALSHFVINLLAAETRLFCPVPSRPPLSSRTFLFSGRINDRRPKAPCVSEDVAPWQTAGEACGRGKLPDTAGPAMRQVIAITLLVIVCSPLHNGLLSAVHNEDPSGYPAILDDDDVAASPCLTYRTRARFIQMKPWIRYGYGHIQVWIRYAVLYSHTPRLYTVDTTK